VVAVLCVFLWAGHKGMWYWSAGVRTLIAELERERNEWRTLALMLMEKQGINLPPGFNAEPDSILKLGKK